MLSSIMSISACIVYNYNVNEYNQLQLISKCQDYNGGSIRYESTVLGLIPSTDLGAARPSIWLALDYFKGR